MERTDEGIPLGGKRNESSAHKAVLRSSRGPETREHPVTDEISVPPSELQRPHLAMLKMMAGTPRSPHIWTWLVWVSCGAYEMTTGRWANVAMISAARPQTPAPSSSTVLTPVMSMVSGSFERNTPLGSDPPLRGRVTLSPSIYAKGLNGMERKACLLPSSDARFQISLRFLGDV